MKRTTKKLQLDRTTIRPLTEGQLGGINGAGTQTCAPSISQSGGTSVISGGTSVISISGGTSVISGGH